MKNHDRCQLPMAQTGTPIKSRRIHSLQSPPVLPCCALEGKPNHFSERSTSTYRYIHCTDKRTNEPPWIGENVAKVLYQYSSTLKDDYMVHQSFCEILRAVFSVGVGNRSTSAITNITLSMFLFHRHPMMTFIEKFMIIFLENFHTCLHWIIYITLSTSAFRKVTI